MPSSIESVTSARPARSCAYHPVLTPGKGGGVAAQAGAEESGGVRAGQAVCEERRAGGVDGVQAELRSRILLQSSAAALSISPAEIATVRVTELGAVDVRGTLEPDREHRLEAVLQANREFLSLYREVRERWESGAVEVATAMQSYA